MKTTIANLQLFVIVLLCFGMVPQLAAQQQRKSMPTVGWLWYGASPAGAMPTLESALFDGLRELGYIEGKTLKLEHRFAQGRPEQLPDLAKELVHHNAELIIAVGSEVAVATKKATSTVPIVIGMSEDPVRASVVESLARPGGNVTGVSFLSNELAGKRIELLKEINPKLSRVSVILNPAHLDDELKVIQQVAEKLSVQVHPVSLQRLDALDGVLAAMSKDSPQALIVVPSRLTSLGRSQLAASALKLRIPMISGWREFAEAGAITSYGPDREAMARRLAYYVDRILKGTKPADLPVELPTKFELIVNLQTAKQIGLAIPPNVLARADRVIR